MLTKSISIQALREYYFLNSIYISSFLFSQVLQQKQFDPKMIILDFFCSINLDNKAI